MFEIRKSSQFAAAHTLRGYEGPCSRNHGHNYKVEIVVRGEQLDDQQMILDCLEMDRILAPVIDKVDHRNLNEIPPFDSVNPTAEAIAAWFFRELKTTIAARTDGRGRLSAVNLWETPDFCVTYSETD